MAIENPVKKTTEFFRNSATLKMVSIGILLLVLLIPTSMISSLLHERESRRDYVVAEINQKWGNSQTLTGPFVTVPYKVFYEDEDNTILFNTRYFHVLPDQLKVNGKLDTQVRYRGIYEAVLYNSRLAIEGSFSAPAVEQLNVDPQNIMWDKATFSLGISDMRGIQEAIEVNYDGQRTAVDPGLVTTDIATSGVSCPIAFNPSSGENNFSLNLNLNGSDEIEFIPVAEQTQVAIESSWPSPSFMGAFLPATRTVDASGFSAKWNVLHLNRNFPQLWLGQQYRVDDAAFGLKLLITADVYQKSTRVAKYAVMFIVFTFSAFFFSEIINKRRVHPMQYLLIGLAIILFYVLQLSLCEHIDFDYAYGLSALVVTLLITGYSHGIIKNRSFTFTVLGILSILYSYLYIVLQLEDYALIMGSVGLLTVLGVVMYITRKIDWYAIDGKRGES